jgi:hypothetical protein
VEANGVNRTVTGDYAVVANNTYVNWTTSIYSFVIGKTRTYHGEVHPESFTQQVFINGQAPPAYVTFEVDAYPSSNAGALGNTGPSATAQTLEALLFINGNQIPDRFDLRGRDGPVLQRKGGGRPEPDSLREQHDADCTPEHQCPDGPEAVMDLPDNEQ